MLATSSYVRVTSGIAPLIVVVPGSAILLECAPFVGQALACQEHRRRQAKACPYFAMRILTRYVLFDLLKVFLLTLTGLTLLIFIVLIGKEAVDKGIGLGPLLRMAPYLIPQAMQFAVPGTMLLATTSVYGRMASYNEIVAIKALGISPMVLVWPTLDPRHARELRRGRGERHCRELGNDGRAARVSGVDRRSDVQPAENAAHVQPGQSQHHGPRSRRPSFDLAHADRASERR